MAQKDVARISRYEVIETLGEGEMGRVLLARDTVLGRQVALKVLRDDLALAPELRAELAERIQSEARAVAAISHPGIVTLHDMGEDEDLGLFLVFERIPGDTLRQRLRQGGPLPAAEVARLARVLGAALTHAHAAGVVHRDVKPENVMLSPVGPKLTDFGIARIPGGSPARASALPGTIAYSAPEALAKGAFGPASDQFSLAATLYEALTGQRAFSGDDALAVATRVATSKHRAPRSVRADLRRFAHVDIIFDRALAKEAKSRFGSCEAFGDALAAELEGANAAFATMAGSRPSIPPSRTSLAIRATRRWQNVAVVAALAVIGVLVAIGRFREPSARGRPGEGDPRGESLQDVASAALAASAAGATTRPRVVPSTSGSGADAEAVASPSSAR
jgi:serine/threonine-protein kinase